MSFRYNSSGRISSVTDHTGRVVGFSYDPAGYLTAAKDVFTKSWTYTYSGNNLTKIIDPDNNTVESIEYDAQGRVYNLYDGANTLKYEMVYNSDGTASVKDAAGNTSTYQYGSQKTLTGKVNPQNNSVTKTYNGNFQATTVTNELGNTTKMSWTSTGGNLARLVDPSGNQISMFYNLQNNTLQEVADSQNHLTSYTYEGVNIKTIEYPLAGVIQTYSYTPDGYLGSVIDPNQNTITYGYNSDGELTSILLPTNTIATQNTYDSLGRLTDTQNPLGSTTHYEYDSAGRLVKQVENYVSTRPQNDLNKYNLTTLNQYDSRNQLIAVTDTYGMITRTYFDAAGRTVTVVQNLTGKAIADPVPPDRTSGAVDENIRMDTYYDNNGNMIAQVDPLGVITRYYFDSNNRQVTVVLNLTGKTISDPMPPVYNSDFPTQNVRKDTVYDPAGNAIAVIDKNGKTDRTYYDASSRPIVVVKNLTGQLVTDPNPPSRSTSTPTTNLITETQYDPSGNVIATIGPTGVITRTYYDAMNRPNSVVQNLKGQDISVTVPPVRGSGAADENIRADTYYDNNGNVIATVNPVGNVARNYYDASNRVVTTVQNLMGQDIYILPPPQRGSGNSDENIRTDYTYDGNGRQITSTDPLGHVIRNEYDEVGRLSKKTVNVMDGQPQNYQDQYNIVTLYSFDAVGRQISTTDTFGKVTATVYDKAGRVSQQIENQRTGQAQNYQNEYNLISSFSYDKGGDQIAVTDTSGTITRTYFDVLQRQVTVVKNLVGQPISNNTPPNRAIPPSNLQNVRTDTYYDGAGNVDRISDSLGKTTVYGFDDLGRKISEEDPLTHTTRYQFDISGQMILKTDRNQIQTEYVYDALGRLIALVENKQNAPADHKTNVRTEYGYDKQGYRVFIRSANAVLSRMNDFTVFSYDHAGRLKNETDPLGHQTSYGYDALGNQTSLLDANGKSTSFGFDALNRLTSIDYPAPDVDVAFTYNALGWRKTMVDEQGTTTWSEDTLGRILNIAAPSGIVEYGYDARGNRTSLKYPNQQTFQYSFDVLNRLAQLSGGSLPGAVGYSYDADGRISGITRPNGVNSSFSFDDAGNLLNISHARFGLQLASYQYTYDPEGNRLTAVEQKIVPTLGMSPVVGLKFVSYSITGKSTPTPTQTSTFTLTPTDTPTPAIIPSPTLPPTETVVPVQNSVTVTYYYDALNRLEAADYDNGNYFHYTYDSNGNRLTETSLAETVTSIYDSSNRLSNVGGTNYTWDNNGNMLSDGVNVYTYTTANRLKNITQGSSTSNFIYNGLGDRIQENGIQFVLDLNAGLTQVLQEGTNIYLYGNERVAQFTGVDSAYFLGDALGSVRQLVDSSGTVTLAKNYEPYGEVLSSVGVGTSNYAFTGEWASSYIKLINLRSRLYSPEMGRFLTRDSWQGNYTRPLSLNRWSYVSGNPVNRVDPSGYCDPSDTACKNKLKEIKAAYPNVTIDEGVWYLWFIPCHEKDATTWTVPELESVQSGLGIIKGGIKYLGGDFSSVVGKVTLKRVPQKGAANVSSKGLMNLTDDWATDPNGWSRVKTVIHETGHIITYNLPLSMTFFMSELGAECKNGSKNDGIEYCFEDTGKPGDYRPGPYEGVEWKEGQPAPLGTHMPSSYSERGNWEDYAETFVTVALEAYVASGDKTYSGDATFLYNNKFRDIGERRRVMQDILDGAWVKRWNR